MSRVLRVLAAALLVGASALPLLAAGTATAADPAAAADPGPAADPVAAGAVTVTGRGPFADLRVTVARTRALRNEVVGVSWTGGTATRGNFAVDYLQVFQCWGDAATGPDREQCQFGGLTGDSRGGAQVASRQVTYGITDPRETYLPRRPGELRYVPFRSVSGKTTESPLSEFFDATTTNEVPYARTRADGGGALPFEVQTGVEAPGLGCGAPAAGPPPSAAPVVVATTPTAATTTAPAGPSAGSAPLVVPPRGAGSGGRGCWLVVVPRGSTEVDGSRRTDDSTNQLLSSPLSRSNWDQRLVVPLDFAPVGQPCPLGRAERPVVGQEQAAEAVGSWQPTLCAGSGPVYSFTQVPDAVARRQAVGDAPGLSLTTRPLDVALLPQGRRPVYAPVALSGLAVAFQIDSQSAFDAPADVKARDGQAVRGLDLTPRLVAKLLTQSYRLGAATQARPGLEKNPLDLTRDPEFLRANPDFRALRFIGIPDVVVPAGLSDGAGLVWEWLLGDADAAAFLGGAPDPDGMVVNPAYRGTGRQDGFPKSDTVCQTFLTQQPPLCTLDARPYAGDGHEAARAAARGDSLSRSAYDAAGLPPTYRRAAPQPTGQRAVLALADTATAQRYGLQVARLRNAAGAFVAPDQSGLLAGLAAMTPSGVEGVLRPAPRSTAAAAYPLTNLTYAVTTPQVLVPAARTDYAAFLRYAAGPGQQAGVAPGQLPPGYAPLPQAQRTQALRASASIVAPAVQAVPAATATATTPRVDQPGAATTGTGGPGAGPLGAAPAAAPFTPFGAPAPGSFADATSPAAPPLPAELLPAPPPPGGVASVPVAAAAVAPAPDLAPVLLGAGRTPADRVGVGRYGAVLSVGLGSGAALLGSVLRRPRRRPTVPV